jgi:hypothetical protein
LMMLVSTTFHRQWYGCIHSSMLTHDLVHALASLLRGRYKLLWFTFVTKWCFFPRYLLFKCLWWLIYP